MKRLNEDFRELIKKFLLNPEQRFVEEAEILLAKEECNEYEAEILELISREEYENAYVKIINYIL